MANGWGRHLRLALGKALGVSTRLWPSALLGGGNGGLDGGAVWVNPIGFTHITYNETESKLIMITVLVWCHNPDRLGSLFVIINTSRRKWREGGR